MYTSTIIMFGTATVFNFSVIQEDSSGILNYCSFFAKLSIIYCFVILRPNTIAYGYDLYRIWPYTIAYNVVYDGLRLS
jgi:hypothetical protein